MQSRFLSLPSFGLAAAAAAIACSSPDAPERSSSVVRQENIGRGSSIGPRVIKGKNSDTSQDAVVLLIHYDPSAGQVASCTGTLLSPRLVLTARHCVADTDESAACDVSGAPLAQGVVRANHPASTMYVFTGPTRPDFSGGTKVTPAGIGMKILDDGGKNLCNHDIAMVVLKEPIADAKISPIRLDGPIGKSELVTAIGWGVTEKTDQPNTRQQRSGIAIVGIGPDDTGNLAVPPNEFQVGESICSGDSGGPALADTGAIIGVVSRGGNATKPNPSTPASSCLNGLNLYTKVAPFKDFILQGFALVEADPWYENGADPRLAKPGATCTDGAECRSNHCLATDVKVPAVTTCAEDCSASACPDGQVCKTEGAVQVCRSPAAPAKATTTTTSGCTTHARGAGSSSSNGAVALALAALGLVALRRRSARS